MEPSIHQRFTSESLDHFVVFSLRSVYLRMFLLFGWESILDEGHETAASSNRQ